MLFLSWEYIVFSFMEFKICVHQILICLEVFVVAGGGGEQNLECSQICLLRCCTYLDLAFATWRKGKVLKLEYGELALPVAGELW